MIAALLERHGLRTGCFTSPHLLSYRERIRIGERDIAPERFAAADRAHACAPAELVDRAAATAGDVVTQFELLTAAALSRVRGGRRRRRGARGGARRALRRDQRRRLARRGADQRRARAHALPRPDGRRTSRARSSTSCGPGATLVVGAGSTRTRSRLARGDRRASAARRCVRGSRRELDVELRAGGGYQRRNFAAACSRGARVPRARARRARRCAAAAGSAGRARALRGARRRAGDAASTAPTTTAASRR